MKRCGLRGWGDEGVWLKGVGVMKRWGLRGWGDEEVGLKGVG